MYLDASKYTTYIPEVSNETKVKSDTNAEVMNSQIKVTCPPRLLVHTNTHTSAHNYLGSQHVQRTFSESLETIPSFWNSLHCNTSEQKKNMVIYYINYISCCHKAKYEMLLYKCFLFFLMTLCT